MKTAAFSVWALAFAGIVSNARAFTVDAQLPAGNVIVESIEGDSVKLHKDLRDTEGDWIYWAFRVKGAAGRTLRFTFSEGSAVGSRGAACSTDRGATWTWTDAVMDDPRDPKTGDHASYGSFSWRFAEGQDEVWFSQTIPYGLREWKDFLVRHAAGVSRFETSVLCRSRKGRDVPYARFGRLDGRASNRLFVTARHHCAEASASFVLEGLLDASLADDELGRWMRENLEIRTVPFADRDGVEDGDQGKNRKPHDHARDYGENPIYPEVKAIMAMTKEWKPTLVIDIHSPWLRGDWNQKDNSNEYIYQVGLRDKRRALVQAEFGRILTAVQENGLYDTRDDFAFGRGWNKGANYRQGATFVIWSAQAFPELALATPFEIPFANARKTTLVPTNLRAFGRDMAKAIRAFVVR